MIACSLCIDDFSEYDISEVFTMRKGGDLREDRSEGRNGIT